MGLKKKLRRLSVCLVGSLPTTTKTENNIYFCFLFLIFAISSIVLLSKSVEMYDGSNSTNLTTRRSGQIYSYIYWKIINAKTSTKTTDDADLETWRLSVYKIFPDNLGFTFTFTIRRNSLFFYTITNLRKHKTFS